MPPRSEKSSREHTTFSVFDDAKRALHPASASRSAGADFCTPDFAFAKGGDNKKRKLRRERSGSQLLAFPDRRQGGRGVADSPRSSLPSPWKDGFSLVALPVCFSSHRIARTDKAMVASVGGSSTYGLTLQRTTLGRATALGRRRVSIRRTRRGGRTRSPPTPHSSPR